VSRCGSRRERNSGHIGGGIWIRCGKQRNLPASRARPSRAPTRPTQPRARPAPGPPRPGALRRAQGRTGEIPTRCCAGVSGSVSASLSGSLSGLEPDTEADTRVVANTQVTPLSGAGGGSRLACCQLAAGGGGRGQAACEVPGGRSSLDRSWRSSSEAARSRPAAQRARPGCSTRLARAGRRGRRGPVGKGTPAVPSPPPSSPTPPVVLLSEATVALDPENEQTVRPALPALTASRMLLVIARRFQTVMAAGQIRSWWSRKAASPGTAPTTSASASAGGTPPSVRAGPRPRPAAERRARPPAGGAPA
jgi:hypothetical protein